MIECEVRIEASPETVFEFFTDPVKAVRWMGTQATLDPRPGGIYKLAMDEQWIAVGEFVEVDPPRRIVFTWGWQGELIDTPPGSSTVEVDLIPDGAATVVRLVHSDLPHEQSTAAHRDGWEMYLPRLAAVVTGREPGPNSTEELR